MTENSDDTALSGERTDTENSLFERKTLLRKEVMHHLKVQHYGEPILFQPLTLKLFSLFFIVLAGCVVAFIAWAELDDTVVVKGNLSPSAGAVRVYPQRDGSYKEILVADGTRVQAGQKLATILVTINDEAGEALPEQSIKSVREQEQDTTKQIELETLLHAQFMERLAASIKESRNELALLKSNRAVIMESLKIASDEMKSAETLLPQKLISLERFNEKRNAALRTEQQLNLIDTEIEVKRNNINDQMFRNSSEPLEFDKRVLSLKARLNQLEIQRIELESRTGNSILAPTSGTVTAMTQMVGGRARTGSPLLTILPDHVALIGEVYVPTRGIGAIAVGQSVSLSYDAFPVGTYGKYPATVTAISGEVLDPREHLLGAELEGPVYAVTVSLEKSWVYAGVDKEHQIPLQSGMTFAASITTQRRTILKRILDPFTHFEETR